MLCTKHSSVSCNCVWYPQFPLIDCTNSNYDIWFVRTKRINALHVNTRLLWYVPIQIQNDETYKLVIGCICPNFHSCWKDKSRKPLEPHPAVRTSHVEKETCVYTNGCFLFSFARDARSESGKCEAGQCNIYIVKIGHVQNELMKWSCERSWQ